MIRPSLAYRNRNKDQGGLTIRQTVFFPQTRR